MCLYLRRKHCCAVLFVQAGRVSKKPGQCFWLALCGEGRGLHIQCVGLDRVFLPLQIDHELAPAQDHMADYLRSAILSDLGARSKQGHLKLPAANSGRRMCRNVLRCKLHRLSVVVVNAYRQLFSQLKLQFPLDWASALSSSVSMRNWLLLSCSSGPSIRKVSSTRSPSVLILARCTLIWC